MTSTTPLSVNLMSELEGTVQGHRDGHGFVVATDGSVSVYISPQEMRAVLHRDLDFHARVVDAAQHLGDATHGLRVQ